MKSHKLLTSTITAAMVATTSVSTVTPIVAQADTINFKDVNESAYYYNDVQWLVEKGIINGYSDGTFQPNKELTREEAATMFVRALNLDTPTDYTDILEDYQDINEEKWSAKDLAAFIEAEIPMENANYFYPAAPLTREVMASWLVKAFDFEETGDDSLPFKDVSQISAEHLPNVKILYQNNIVQGNADGTFAPKSTVTRAQFAIFMKRALTSANKEEVASQEETNTPLELTDADSLNLKQIKITTNQNLEQNKNVINKHFYRVEDENDQIVPIGQVEVDQNEIILTLEEALDASSKATLIVDSSVTGEEEDFRLTFTDHDDPELIQIVPTSKNSFVFQFSEPINFKVENGKRLTEEKWFDSIEIDGEKYIIDRLTVEQFGQALHVELEANLSEGTHDIKWTDADLFCDYADHELDKEDYTFTMKYETDAPTLVQIKDIQPNEMTLVFDKYIKLRYRGYIYHTSSLHYPAQAVVRNGNELVLTFEDEDLITKQTELVLEEGAIEDLWGNQNKEITRTFDIAEDVLPPTITNVEFIDGTITNNKYIDMKVTFSEAVKTEDAEDIDHYELTDEKGNNIAIKEISLETNSSNQSIATLTIDKYYGEVPKQTFTLKADHIEDLVGNEAEDLEYRFIANSEEPPDNFSAKMVLSDDEDEVRMIIDFNREMATVGDYSINQLDLYELTVYDTTVLLDDLQDVSGLNVRITTFQSGKKAEILIEKTGKLTDEWDDFFDDLVEAIDDEEIDELELVVGRVADENGNRTQSIANQVKLSIQSEFEEEQVEAKATDENKIELTFEDELIHFDEDDFTVFWDKDRDERFDSKEELDTDVSIKNVDGESIVTFTLDDDLDADGKYNNRYVYVRTNKNVQTENRYGQTVKIKNLRVEDGIAPEIATDDDIELVYVQAVQNDSSKAIVSIEFTDDIDEDTVTRLTFQIGDGDQYEVESAFVEKSDKICLVIDLDGESISNLVGEYVKQKAAISDENNNIITGITARIYEEKESRDLP